MTLALAQGWGVVAGPNFEFTHTGAAAVGTTPGNWRFLNVQSWLKDLQSDPDQPTDQQGWRLPIPRSSRRAKS
jgi:hypothetical protein